MLRGPPPYYAPAGLWWTQIMIYGESVHFLDGGRVTLALHTIWPRPRLRGTVVNGRCHIEHQKICIRIRFPCGEYYQYEKAGAVPRLMTLCKEFARLEARSLKLHLYCRLG
jgi:hypothetical protein